MDIDVENLESCLKKKYSFKYKPEFSESFKTTIKDSQIIPLSAEVFKKLEWPIVFISSKTVEAKRQGDWKQLTEKITITKKSSGRIQVHSKSLKKIIFYYRINSKRTGLFISLFEKLKMEYEISEKLTALETEYEKRISM